MYSKLCEKCYKFYRASFLVPLLSCRKLVRFVVCIFEPKNNYLEYKKLKVYMGKKVIDSYRALSRVSIIDKSILKYIIKKKLIKVKLMVQ